jgi:hypothetical protein
MDASTEIINSLRSEFIQEANSKFEEIFPEIISLKKSDYENRP